MKSEFEKRVISSLILIPFSFFFIVKGTFFFNFFLILCFFITSIEWYLMSKRKNYLLIGHIFLIFSFYFAFKLRTNFDDESLFLFLFVVVTCISTDIGGYIFGKMFKGPKLTKISPKKTFAGMIGGFFLSIVLIYVYYEYSHLFYIEFAQYTSQTLITVLMISTISQVGDIIISYFKRLSKIKDTGKIIPGHGGILDRIDGMIFSFPFAYFIFSIDFIK